MKYILVLHGCSIAVLMYSAWSWLRIRCNKPIQSGIWYLIYGEAVSFGPIRVNGGRIVLGYTLGNNWRFRTTVPVSVSITTLSHKLQPWVYRWHRIRIWRRSILRVLCSVSHRSSALRCAVVWSNFCNSITPTRAKAKVRVWCLKMLVFSISRALGYD